MRRTSSPSSAADTADTLRRKKPRTIGALAGTKRQRITRACDQCRASKRRCDGGSPECGLCRNNDLPCTYGANLKKRGLPTGYVKSIEGLLALVLAVVPNGEEVLAELVSSVELSLDSDNKFVVSSSLVTNATVLREAWSGSSILSQLNRHLAKLEESVEAAGDTVEKSPDPTPKTAGQPRLSGNPTMATTEGGSSKNTAPSIDHRLDSLYFSPIPRSAGQRPPEPQPRLPNSTAAASSIFVNPASTPPSIPHNSRDLLDIYLSFTHSWFPIAEKHKMMELLYSWQNNMELESSGKSASLWAILAFASLQETQSSASLETSSVSHGLMKSSVSDRMYSWARQMVANEDQDAELGHVQALLVLALYKTRQGALKTAWRLVGRAVRMGLGLQQLGAPSETPGYATGGEGRPNPTLKRALLGCFVLDTLLSCWYHLPPHLRSADITILLPLEESGADEWDPWIASQSLRGGPPQHLYGQQHNSSQTEPMRAISTFNTLVRVTSVLNDMMWSTSPQTRTGVSALGQVLDALPSHCLLPGPDAGMMRSRSQRPSPQVLNLHLAILVVRLISERGGLEPLPHDASYADSLAGFTSAFARDYGEVALPTTVLFYNQLAVRLPLQHRPDLIPQVQDALFPFFKSPGTVDSTDTTPFSSEFLTSIDTPDDISTAGSHLVGSGPISWNFPPAGGSASLAGESILDSLGAPDEIASTFLNQDFLEDIGSSANEEWVHQATQFMRNLGFSNWMPENPE